MNKRFTTLCVAAASLALAACASMTVSGVAGGVAAGIQAGEAAVKAYCDLSPEARQAVRGKLTGGKQILCPADPTSPGTAPPGTLPAPSS